MCISLFTKYTLTHTHTESQKHAHTHTGTATLTNAIFLHPSIYLTHTKTHTQTNTYTQKPRNTHTNKGTDTLTHSLFLHFSIYLFRDAHRWIVHRSSAQAPPISHVSIDVAKQAECQ